MKEINALILHDERQGPRLKRHLSAAPAIRPELARTCEEFKAALREEGRQVVILGTWAPEACAAGMIAWIKRSSPTVKILACADPSEEILPLVLAGANGYVFQDNLEGLCEILARLMEHGFYVPPVDSRKFIEELIAINRSYQVFVNAGITPRELEFIRGQMEARTREEAADRMCVELTTVKSHNRIILKKLGMKRMKDVFMIYGRCLESAGSRLGAGRGPGAMGAQ